MRAGAGSPAGSAGGRATADVGRRLERAEITPRRCWTEPLGAPGRRVRRRRERWPAEPIGRWRGSSGAWMRARARRAGSHRVRSVGAGGDDREGCNRNRAGPEKGNAQHSLMSSETATAIAIIGALVGLAGWGISLVNARNAIRWKRAELANSYLKDLTTNSVLVFACRALEWNGARLVVPEALRPLLSDKVDFIEHDPALLKKAMSPGVYLEDIATEPRLQLYRTAMDDFLSWLGLVSSVLDRNLFQADDVPDVGYWVMQIEQVGYLDDFIREFGYDRPMEKLVRAFARYREGHRDARALTISRGGFGSAGKGRSAGS